ncbi:SulP family inorganic anion transporter [Arthrospiribacter ruber]|uniref:SulP family inorganic anion transporter n=1 Tax=Arthrospiribacter ruber TaxID=2487934 RepID=A0A951IVR4_9BACT|nr:SulP family inorganic anion transporter [Arthrospiribacter ruber]MBW3467212.1 SulP family inorganic anion transporter [Arthrospiribacter ruber]
MKPSGQYFKHLEKDLPAGLVVFLVALPLCLGIALASGAPLFSGIIAGIVGGIVVGFISGSHTSVSGPAAGLTVIVLSAITELGSFELFLSAVFLAGIIQVIFGVVKAGVIGYYFPTAVIKGMLAGIGLILIIKQLPYALGLNGERNFGEYFHLSEIWKAEINFSGLVNDLHFGGILIAGISLAILILWERPEMKRGKITSLVPGPLLVVIIGILLNEAFREFVPSLFLNAASKVELPILEKISNFPDLFTLPDFSQVFTSGVWVTAITISIIASLETLLNMEAADKIDPYKRVSPPNRELFAQGFGNMINGLIGGLPVTAVIVRSSANVSSGARTKTSTVFHGILLLVSVILIPKVLNLIPLACLAAILILIGYKLTRISLFKTQAKLGWDQFLPFVITISGILIYDLLIGIGMGMVVAVFFILLRNYQTSMLLIKGSGPEKNSLTIKLPEEVSFLNKGSLIKNLEEIPDGSHLIIDGSDSRVIDYDVLEVIENFKVTASTKNILVETVNIKSIKISSLD